MCCQPRTEAKQTDWPTHEAALDYRDAAQSTDHSFTRVTRVPPMSTESESPACH